MNAEHKRKLRETNFPSTKVGVSFSCSFSKYVTKSNEVAMWSLAKQQLWCLLTLSSAHAWNW